MSMEIPALPLLSGEELRKEIALLESIDLKSVTIDYLKDRLICIFNGIKMVVPFIQANCHLFRAVQWETMPRHSAQLIYPPPEKILTLGRANRTGQPLFYCSNSAAAALHEIGVAPGNLYVISTWKTREKFLVSHEGYTEDVYTHIRRSDVPDWITKTREWCEERDLLIQRFLQRQFTKNVPAGEEHLYRMSVAIAEKRFEDSQFEGLLYPTVAANARADNLALKPACSDTRLDFVRAEYVRVTIAGEDKIEFQVLNVANTLSEIGDINWIGGPQSWILRKEGKFVFTVENGQWVARNADGNIFPADTTPRAVTVELPQIP